MTYTATVNNRGTFTIPSKLREEMEIQPGSKILIMKKNGEYIFRIVPKISSLEGKFKTNKTLSDSDLKAERKKTFLKKTTMND